MAQFRGQPVAGVEFIRKRDIYALFGPDGALVAELSPPAFKSQPQLRGVPHGRHWGTVKAASRRAAYTSGGADPGAGSVTHFTFGPHTFQAFFGPVPFPEPPQPIEAARIRAGEIIACRVWLLKGGYLYSVYQAEQRWPPRVPVSGDVESGLGVHAFKDGGDCRKYVEMKLINELFEHTSAVDLFGRGQWVPSRFVFGTVYLWGAVVEHERGYRAEFAQIRSLDAGDESHIYLDTLRKLYGVEHPPSDTGTA